MDSWNSDFRSLFYKQNFNFEDGFYMQNLKNNWNLPLILGVGTSNLQGTPKTNVPHIAVM